MEFSIVLGEQYQRQLKDAPMGNALREQRFREAMEGLNEFCVVCLIDMGFPKMTHVDAPVRSENGAGYTVGGEVCGECNRAIIAADRNDGAMFE